MMKSFYNFFYGVCVSVVALYLFGENTLKIIISWAVPAMFLFLLIYRRSMRRELEESKNRRIRVVIGMVVSTILENSADIIIKFEGEFGKDLLLWDRQPSRYLHLFLLQGRGKRVKIVYLEPENGEESGVVTPDRILKMEDLSSGEVSNLSPDNSPPPLRIVK